MAPFMDPALQTAVLETAGVSVALAAFVIAVLRMEVELPLSVCLLVVPSVIGLGFGVAIVLRFWVGLSMLLAAAVLSALVICLVAVYEGLAMLASEPDPPTARY